MQAALSVMLPEVLHSSECCQCQHRVGVCPACLCLCSIHTVVLAVLLRQPRALQPPTCAGGPQGAGLCTQSSLPLLPALSAESCPCGRARGWGWDTH